MVAIIGLLCAALLMCVLLLMRSTPVTGKAPAPKRAPHLKDGEPRPQGPRATGLN
jgi:hypothetical protein